jgi:hypothetical protein
LELANLGDAVVVLRPHVEFLRVGDPVAVAVVGALGEMHEVAQPLGAERREDVLAGFGDLQRFPCVAVGAVEQAVLVGETWSACESVRSTSRPGR